MRYFLVFLLVSVFLLGMGSVFGLNVVTLRGVENDSWVDRGDVLDFDVWIDGVYSIVYNTNTGSGNRSLAYPFKLDSRDLSLGQVRMDMWLFQSGNRSYFESWLFKVDDGLVPRVNLEQLFDLAVENLSVAFSLDVVDSSGVSSVIIDSGSGNFSYENLFVQGNSGFPVSFRLKFDKFGNFTVRVWVEDSSGKWSGDSLDVSVEPLEFGLDKRFLDFYSLSFEKSFPASSNDILRGFQSIFFDVVFDGENFLVVGIKPVTLFFCVLLVIFCFVCLLM